MLHRLFLTLNESSAASPPSYMNWTISRLTDVCYTCITAAAARGLELLKLLLLRDDIVNKDPSSE